MLFQHHMEIGAAEAVSTDAGAAGCTVGRFPGTAVVQQIKWRLAKINVMVRRIGVQRGRQEFLVQGHGRLKHPGRTGARFQMADIALGRTKTDAVAGCAAKHGRQTFHFSHITHRGAGAVRLHQGGRRRVQPSVFPGTLDG